ncbi:MAG: hypothetical protein IIW12_03610, partial [Oscillospiraceae bacterium]|nr:hypothetical protein [Oscillospiraceae bacterium]
RSAACFPPPHFFRLCSVFFYFTGFFPFGKIRFQEEDIFLAVFSFLFSGCCFRNFSLAFSPASVMMVAGHSARVSVTLV